MYSHVCVFPDAEFGKKRGNGPIERASEAKFALRFEISDLNFLHFQVHIAYMSPFCWLWDLLTASKVKSDLVFEINDLNYICESGVKASLLFKYPLCHQEKEMTNMTPWLCSHCPAARNNATHSGWLLLHAVSLNLKWLDATALITRFHCAIGCDKSNLSALLWQRIHANFWALSNWQHCISCRRVSSSLRYSWWYKFRNSVRISLWFCLRHTCTVGIGCLRLLVASNKGGEQGKSSETKRKDSSFQEQYYLDSHSPAVVYAKRWPNSEGDGGKGDTAVVSVATQPFHRSRVAHSPSLNFTRARGGAGREGSLIMYLTLPQKIGS